MLVICVDFKSAASYLAFEPTLTMIEETGIEAQWLPFSSRPFTIPDKKPDETVGERHRRVRAIAQRDTHLHYARVQGREMKFADDPAGSDAALTAMAALLTNPVSFMHAAFKAYWTGHADLDDKAVVKSLLEATDHGEIDWAIGSKRLKMIRSQAEERKVFETPTYLINDQIFLGREHLPWIRSIIAENSD